MGTESPIRDVMIEVVSSDLVSFDAIRTAGELIAADASFCSRMAALQGRSEPRVYLGGLKLYQEQIDAARTAWNAFKTATTPSPPTAEMHEALVSALIRIKTTLDHSPDSPAR